MDDDARGGGRLVESDGTTSVTEAAGAGNTDDFTVVLDAQPLTDVVLTVVSGDLTEATVDQATLTFTNADWDSPQTVTVTGVDEALVDGPQNTLITMSVDAAHSHNAFDALADQRLAAVIGRLEIDDLLEFVEWIPEERREGVVDRLPEDKREELHKAELYPEHSAGRVMTTSFVALDRKMSAQDAIDPLRSDRKSVV